MAKLGKQHAHLFLSDPRFNERKTIEERFQRKPFSSLAVDLYKSKLQNNPMRTDPQQLRAGIVAPDKENAGPENLAAVYAHESRLRIFGAEPQANRTFDTSQP